MITKGLKEEEMARLAAAGFAPSVVEAVAREALTLRWLFLRRAESVVLVLVVIAALGLHALIGAWLETFGLEYAIAVTIGVSWVLGLLLGRDEIEAMTHDPTRWAARRLAVMAVEVRSADRVFNTQPFKALSRHGAATAGLRDTPAALRIVAQRLTQEADRAARPGTDADGSAARYPVGLIVLAGCTVFLIVVMGARTF